MCSSVSVTVKITTISPPMLQAMPSMLLRVLAAHVPFRQASARDARSDDPFLASIVPFLTVSAPWGSSTVKVKSQESSTASGLELLVEQLAAVTATEAGLAVKRVRHGG